jgi:DNA-binding GntR family transcriptional regulator
MAAIRIDHSNPVRRKSGSLPNAVTTARITERELAQRYGVNRAPLREALLRLEERRLIERVPFSGTRVFQPSKRMLSELYDIREVLEGLAVRRAAETATDAQVEELTRLARDSSERLAKLPAGDSSVLPHIRDIHMRIAEISGNQELVRILNSEIWLYLRANHRRWVNAPEKRAFGALQHERIAEAIVSRDGEIAETLMRKHIRTSRAAWMESLNGSNGAS